MSELLSNKHLRVKSEKTLCIKKAENGEYDYNKRWPAVVATIIVFCVLVLFNFFIPTMRSLPDELGAVALAAKLAGYDWSYVLTHPEMYYGSGTVILTYPFFVLIKDPIVLYQCLLGVAALLHALVAYVACRILIKFRVGEFNDIEVILIGIICAIFTPTRTSNIDNEPMLVLICWFIVYLIMLLQYSNKKNDKRKYTILLAFVLAYSYLSHTRAIIYTMAIIGLMILYYFFVKKVLVDLKFFVGSFLIMFIPINCSINYIKEKLFTNMEVVNSIVTNSPEGLANTVTSGIGKILTNNGIHGFLDLFCGNLWIIFVFTGGLFAVAIYFIVMQTYKLIKIRLTTKDVVDSEEMYFPYVYSFIGLIITLIGLCVVWINSGIRVYEIQSNLSRGHFYLRYYGNFIAPFFFFTFIYLYKNIYPISKKIFSRILLVVIVIASYCLLGFVTTAKQNYTYNLDWFYYFAPFTFKFDKWPNMEQNLGYFLMATNIVIVCFLVYTYLAKKNKKSFIIMILVFGLWQYVYGVIYYDRPFASSQNYYLSANASYELRKQNSSIFDDCDTIYYNNTTYGPAYIVQFTFLDKKVINNLDLIDFNNQDTIIISDKVIQNKLNKRFSYVKLDDNEYLYIDSIARKAELESMGYKLNNY